MDEKALISHLMQIVKVDEGSSFRKEEVVEITMSLECDDELYDQLDFIVIIILDVYIEINILS